MTTRSELADRNPFDPKLTQEPSTRRFSTEKERTDVASDLKKMKRDGYVIFPDLINQAKTKEIAEEFNHFHAETPTENTEFGGHSTQRVYNLVARTRVVDDLILHPRTSWWQWHAGCPEYSA